MEKKKQSAAGDIIVEKTGHVTVIKLDYPERRNALSMTIREKLGAALNQADADDNCRVIVLTGEGAHFSSGGDISGFEGITAVSGRKRMRKSHELIIKPLIAREKPVIAAVEGHAAGAGLCLAANCDIVVASTEAKFTCSFNKIGLLPDLGGLWSIPQRIGMGRAKLLMMTGRMIDAQTAQNWGLIEELAEPGKALAEAITLGEEIAQNSPLSNGLVKAAFARGPLDLDAVLALEVDLQGLLFGTRDFEEGRVAFLEKRHPQFKGE